MQKHFFLAGTDTDVGKTVVSCALLRQATAAGLSTLGLKPIAAGCEKIDGEYRNDDALALMASSTASLPYKAVNPIAFADPIAPHIAAMHSGVSVSASDLAFRVAGYLSGWLQAGLFKPCPVNGRGNCPRRFAASGLGCESNRP